MFGLEPTGRWNLDDVLALMVEKVGVSPDTRHLRGADRIDPDLHPGRSGPDGQVRRAGRPGPVPGAARDRPPGRAAGGAPGGRRRPRTGGCDRARARPGVQLPVDDPLRPGRPAGRATSTGSRSSSSTGDLNHTHSATPMRGAARCPGRRRRGRRRTSSSPTTAGPARPARPASPPSGSPTATTRRCSSARPRARSPSRTAGRQRAAAPVRPDDRLPAARRGPRR